MRCLHILDSRLLTSGGYIYELKFVYLNTCEPVNRSVKKTVSARVECTSWSFFTDHAHIHLFQCILHPRVLGVASGEEDLHAVVEVVVETFFDRLEGGALFTFRNADGLFFELHFLGEGFFHLDE